MADDGKQKIGYTINENGEYEGVVYLYRLKEGYDVLMTGWGYYGETAREQYRQYSFYSSAYKYAGEKLNKVRNIYGPDAFDYEVVVRIWDKDLENLKRRLREIETQLIKDNDSIAHGFNSSEGGCGMKGIKLSDETRRKMSASAKKRWNNRKNQTN